MEFRALNLKRLQAFARQGFFSVADYMADPLRFQAALESLSFCDYSLAIKAGVRAVTSLAAQRRLPFLPIFPVSNSCQSFQPMSQTDSTLPVETSKLERERGGRTRELSEAA